MVQLASRVDYEEEDLKPEAALAALPLAVSPDEILVGGSNSAFPLPFKGCIARGSGSRVWDEDGTEYVDFLLGSGAQILGHAHPAVCTAVARQLAMGSAFHALNRPALELARRVVEMPGCVELLRFASTGTEATLHAVRLARAFTGREKVLLFAGAYHGSHDLSIIGHRGAARAPGGGVPRGTIEDVVIARFNEIESVRQAFAEHGDELAAVLIEPQQRSLDPVPGFLSEVADLCRSAGTVFIFDEVLTGFRLAYGGAQEYYGVQPDLVCYGKILGGGFPLSAIGGTRDIMRLADPALVATPGFVHVSGTLSGNPISATAGLATLSELEQAGAYERLHDLGGRLRRGLAGELANQGVAGSVIGSGPIAAVEFADTGEPGSGRVFRDAVAAELITRGVLAQLQTRFYVSLAHVESDVDRGVEAFGESMGAAMSRGNGHQAALPA